ncbi:amidohydrolase family protein [Robertkochia aurantiaca]|uniref:amidohydrolase family protein n=1 Tax=Robertkochia aurantiaca TaxID=2873700 RepID=UPI001CCEE003|nr:amidohydrolase family protein [Robertkochia sp. 3YJGBD-33]
MKNFFYVGIPVILLTLLMAFRNSDVQSFGEFMRGQPVIDVHVHLTKGIEGNEVYTNGTFQEGPQLDEVRLQYLQYEFNNNNVVLAIGGGVPKYAALYGKKEPRIWSGLIFPCSKLVDDEEPCEKEFLGYEELKALYDEQGFRAMGESLYNYYGIPPTDPRLAPYWKFAAERNLPVGIHSDSGPNRVDEKERPHFNPEFANPEALRPVLDQYPNLKIYLMHYGNDYTDEAIALMNDYPQIYCDISAISILLPKRLWEQNLRKLYAAGLGDRLMFGSDYFGTTRQHLKAIFDIGWLYEEQKRDILYYNAARFLELSEEEIRQHHAWVRPR